MHDGAPTGVAVREMLRPMPGLNGLTLNALEVAPPMSYWPPSPGDVPPESRLVIRGVPQKSSPALRSGQGETLDTVDPLVAQAKGWLRFEESGVDAETVVAFVKGNPKPILLPAGQLLGGGLTDRVLAEPVLLPAAPVGERRENVSCRVVRVGVDREGAGAPRLTEWIAGPSIRALLARGASEDVVLQAVEAHVRARMTRQPQHLAAFSLMELFESPEGPVHPWVKRSLDAVRGARTVWKVEHHAGFVALDGMDGVLGIEIVRLRGEAGTALLTRLYLGYLIEAVMRQQGAEIGQAVVALDTGFEIFQRDASSFVCARESAPGVLPQQRLSTADVKRAGMHFQAFEIDGEPAVVSAAPKK